MSANKTKIKHVPRYMKLPLIKNIKYTNSHGSYMLMRKGYTMLDKYLGGK